jgi:hypothetical protein
MNREDAEAVDSAAQAMWKADGGDERKTILAVGKDHRWQRSERECL